MSILINKDTKIIVQGLTGKTGTFHTEQALAYHGTQMVAGTHPKKAAKPGRVPMVKTYPCSALLPKQKTVLERMRQLSMCHPRVPPRLLKSQLMPRLELITCITEGVPVLDMVQVKEKLNKSNSRLIGPNCPGLMTPDECKIGIMPPSIFFEKVQSVFYPAQAH